MNKNTFISNQSKDTPRDFRISIPLPIASILSTFFAVVDNLYVAKVVSSHANWVEFETCYSGTHLRFNVVTKESARMKPNSYVRFNSMGQITVDTEFVRTARHSQVRY